MKNVLFLMMLALVATSSLNAQAEKSDPAAKTILDKVRKKYEAYKTIEASFSLSIELPGQPKQVQKGTISQDGNKFRLEMTDQIIVSDGKTTWVYVKKNNEVQITNADPGGASDNGFMTPKDLLSRYEKGDFIYVLLDKISDKGAVLTQIEFKPKDKKSDFSKLRLSIDEKKSLIKSIMAFGKDGSRYNFSLNTTTPNKKFGSGHFTFDPKKYPGVRVEDLRM
jgi:outer membrane lipoprotein carrier protein